MSLPEQHGRELNCASGKVKSLSPVDRFVIAFCSPDGSRGITNARMPSGEKGRKAEVEFGERHFLQSGLERRVLELRPFLAIFSSHHFKAT
jgi:hypothetical protein